MEMIRTFKRKFSGVSKLRVLCTLCVVLMVIGLLEVIFEVILFEYGTGPDGNPKMYVYTTSSRHMPIHYWRHRQRFPGRYKQAKNAPNCTRLPYPGDIVFATPYWQRFLGDRFSAYLYTAYWEKIPHPHVSVILLSSGLPQKVSCKLWFLNEAAPWQVEAETRLLGGSIPGSGGSEVQTAYSVDCQLGGKVYRHPVAVSLTNTVECKSLTNVVTIVNIPSSSTQLNMGYYKHPPLLPVMEVDISIGVCVMWPDQDQDNAELAAHWFEMLRILGAHRIYIAINQAHKRVHDLIHFYEQTGLVLKLAKSRPLSSSSLLALSREQLIQYESTFHTFVYTDCLYQAREQHNYLLMLKPFEMILPEKEDDIWVNLLMKDAESLTPQHKTSDALLIDRWNAAGDEESNEDQVSDENLPYRSFQRTDSVALTKLAAPVTCIDQNGDQRSCLIKRFKKPQEVKFLPYTAVHECTQKKTASGIKTKCMYRPHELLSTLWFFVDPISQIALDSLY